MLFSAGLEWYKTGTVNATNGSNVITGTNTDWKDAGLKNGDIFTMDDSTLYEIANVATNTTLTLVKAYRGSTVTGQSYGIIRNFAATIPAEVMSEITYLMRKYKAYIDADLTHIKGERGDPGFYFKGAWTEAITYNVLDVVMYNNKLYIAKIDHVSIASNAPGTSASTWQDMSLTVPTGVDIFNYNNAGLHNSIFRGKNLGSSFTASQSAAIRAGTFTDLWVGDYWSVTNLAYSYVNSSGATVNSTFTGNIRIASCNYYLHSGDSAALTINHINVVPDNTMFSCSMNTTNTTANAYVGSNFYTSSEGLARAKAIIIAFFGSDHMLSHRVYLHNAVTNGIPTAGAWYNSDVELMTEPMLYGTYVFASGASDGTNIRHRHTIDCKQLNVFQLEPRLISNRQWFWLRDVASATSFAAVDATGFCNILGASSNNGARPVATVY
ncbi:MAG: hypothetical protein IJQ74_00130 [Synergistaceae bacterium]|nr:hypothetical protein [Synergistaceae bacterium]